MAIGGLLCTCVCYVCCMYTHTPPVLVMSSGDIHDAYTLNSLEKKLCMVRNGGGEKPGTKAEGHSADASHPPHHPKPYGGLPLMFWEVEAKLCSEPFHLSCCREQRHNASSFPATQDRNLVSDSIALAINSQNNPFVPTRGLPKARGSDCG